MRVQSSSSASDRNILLSDITTNNASSSKHGFAPKVDSSGKILVSNGTNWVASTPTFPNASATTRKIIVSDGTNWTASTETYAAPGTSGNVMRSDGTNWTSVVPIDTVTAPTLVNSWTDSAGGNTLSGYWKDSLGIVHIQGMITGGSISTAFTLPTGYRPPLNVSFQGANNIAITSAGVFLVQSGNTNVPINGLSFRTT